MYCPECGYNNNDSDSCQRCGHIFTPDEILTHSGKTKLIEIGTKVKIVVLSLLAAFFGLFSLLMLLLFIFSKNGKGSTLFVFIVFVIPFILSAKQFWRTYKPLRKKGTAHTKLMPPPTQQLNMQEKTEGTTVPQSVTQTNINEPIPQKLQRLQRSAESKPAENPFAKMSYEELRALPEYESLKDYISQLGTINMKDFVLKQSPYSKDRTIALLSVFKLEKSLIQIGEDKWIYVKNNSLLDTIDSMSAHGQDFELLTVELLKANGFEKAHATQGSGDYGIDVIAEKDGVTYAIQCKCYSGSVGNKAVQEAYSGKSFYNCMVAVVFTNNYFTRAAIETAERNNVLLWDRTKLIEMLNNSGI